MKALFVIDYTNINILSNVVDKRTKSVSINDDCMVVIILIFNIFELC